MITIIDHAYEKESVLQGNLSKVHKALAAGESVRIYHPAGFIHGRLMNIPGVEYMELASLPTRYPPNMQYSRDPLFIRLTGNNDYRCPFAGTPKGDLFIHWYYRDRKEDKLSLCEIFHLNMLRYFNAMDRVNAIHIRCAAKTAETESMRNAMAILASGHAKVDFRIMPQKDSWEHDTFKEAVEYAVSTGEYVRYIHFKGVSHIEDPNLIGGYRNGGRAGKINSLDILYWCFLLYSGIFNAPDDAKAVGPIHFLGKSTLHYSSGQISHPWALKGNGHYTGSFQAFDGGFLKERFRQLGVTGNVRINNLWVGDPYTVEQFLSLCFKPSEVYTIGQITRSAYHLYAENYLPERIKRFRELYAYEPLCKNLCVANGTYKYIGGTDTFNWAMCSAFKKLGYNVYYYAPDMDGNGVTEKYLQEIGIMPYKEGIPLAACFANQQSGKHFIGKCPVVQTCHSKWTALEWPVKGANAYVAISEEIQDHLKTYGFSPVLMRNGEDLERYAPVRPLHQIPRVLSICQGDDSLLKEACLMLGWQFRSVPKEVKKRVWHVEDMINDADIVVGIGRSLYDGMACGRACVSWDNRKLDPYSGCGYITAANWHICARTNFTGRGFPKINTLGALIGELKKYKEADGAVMRSFAEQELNAAANALKYLELAGIRR